MKDQPPQEPNSQQITMWLQLWQNGDEHALENLFSYLYTDLKRLAKRAMRNESAGHTLQPTALVNEIYSRLHGVDVDWANRDHFLAVTAQAMRRVLVDHARKKAAEKRGGGLDRISLDDLLHQGVSAQPQILELDDAMMELGKLDARKERVVELHYYAGLSHPEIARLLGVSAATVDRDLRMARAWLSEHLSAA